jgi:CubicO group peptidase (beta-lactamase class C family)
MPRPALPGSLALWLALCLGACTPAGPAAPTPMPLRPVERLVATPPTVVGMAPTLDARLDSLAAAAIADRAAPGMAIAVARHGRLVSLRTHGRLDWAPGSAPVTDSTIYDLASLTKVVGTTTAAMILEEEGKLDLGRTVASYLPELNDPAKAGITLHMLLAHRGGMEAFAALFRDFRGREQYLEQINRRPLRHAPGTVTEYSDWDLILLQLVVERLAGQPLDRFLQARVFGPLGMRDTGFRPDPALRPRVAPTEVQEIRGGQVWGEVHDENAWAIGGVAGHAGLFSSARDLAVFAQMMLNGGSYGGVRVLKPATIARWTARQGAGSSRALGWDTPSPGSSAGRFFSPRSFGHTGFTGTSLWIDPEKGLFVVLLSNRVNPTRDNPRVGPLRRAVADAVQGAVTDAPLVEWEEER